MEKRGATLAAADRSSFLSAHRMSEEEYSCLREGVGREPTVTELGMFSALWSEHCSYKTSRHLLRTLPTTGEDVIHGPGENAGVVRLWEDLCAVFKVESHNHPSYIDPYQGAATGVGGIMRDVFCMGARPVANLNALQFGSLSSARQRWLYEHVVGGIGDYGNCVGVPTVGGCIGFDPRYERNIVMNAMTVGVAREGEIFTAQAGRPGDVIIYAGARTGCDGIQGASMASAGFSSSAGSERSAVQVGDPFREKLLLEAVLELTRGGWVRSLQDMGAAGLASSLFEMLASSQTGAEVRLDDVPTRQPGMTAYELLLSESQERMLLMAGEEHLPDIERILGHWETDWAVIGRVVADGRLKMHHLGRCEVDLDVQVVAAATPSYVRPVAAASRPVGAEADLTAWAEGQGLARLVATIDERRPETREVYRRFDRSIGLATYRDAEEGGAAVLQLDSSGRGLAVALACRPSFCAADPCGGMVATVLQAYGMVVAAGGEPIALTDCLNYGNPEDPAIMSEFAEGIAGLREVSTALSLPVVSGNVSFYNESDGESIPPTPVIGVVGRVADCAASLPAVPISEDPLWLLTQGPAFWGGSLAAAASGQPVPAVPPLEMAAVATFWREMRRQLAAGASMARDVGGSGVVTTLVKMGVGAGDLGFTLDPGWTLRELAGCWWGALIVQSSAQPRVQAEAVAVRRLGVFGGGEPGFRGPGGEMIGGRGVS